MTKFEKLNTNFFTALFAVAAIAEFIGFFSGKTWCLWAAIFSAMVSAMVYFAAKAESKKYQQSKTNRNV